MYLSLLSIDVSDRKGRTWLANPYRVHQRLLMAFPDGQAGRVLFRIEDDREPARILVQSPGPADWEGAFSSLPILAGRPQQKPVSLALRSGQRLRFFLRANPTVRRVFQPVPDGQPVPEGKRVGIGQEDKQREWLARKGEAGGFCLAGFEVRPRGMVSVHPAEGPPRRYLAADFEGILVVTDPVRLRETVEAGIGSGKAFGFGLLSLAPA